MCVFLEQTNVPYFVKLRVTNCAGGSISMFSSPFLIDYTKPVSGVVVDGTDFQEDILWFGNPHQIQGRNKEKLIVIIFLKFCHFIFYQFKTKVHIIFSKSLKLFRYTERKLIYFSRNLLTLSKSHASS